MRGLTGGRERRGEGLGERKELIQTRNAVTCWTGTWVVGDREARLVAHMQQALGRSWDVRQAGSRLSHPGACMGESSRDTRQLTATSGRVLQQPAAHHHLGRHLVNLSSALSLTHLVAGRVRHQLSTVDAPPQRRPPSPKVKRPRRFCHEMPDVALVHSSDD